MLTIIVPVCTWIIDSSIIDYNLSLSSTNGLTVYPVVPAIGVSCTITIGSLVLYIDETKGVIRMRTNEKRTIAFLMLPTLFRIYPTTTTN